MEQLYPMPAGMHAIPPELLDLRPDADVDYDLLHPKPISDEKNIWFFWHSGYSTIHPYAKRTVRAWHRRFSRLGWTIRVLDRAPGSPLNAANFLNISDPENFPEAFRAGTIGGDYGRQHTSDLVRWPLLLRYGGVYADVGMMQIGDLDRLWRETVGNPESPWEMLSYNSDVKDRSLTNYFLCSRKGNAMFARCHKLLLKLWEGRTSTEGLHNSALLRGVELMGDDSLSIDEEGEKVDGKGVQKMLTDYIIQGQVMTLVMGLIDEEDGWNGPQYVVDHIYAIPFMEGSQLINEMTAWDGNKAFRLMSLQMPKEGEMESEEQKQAREIVEACLGRSFGFKLAHGLVLRVLGETLGSLWRSNEGSDVVEGTYAHWLRHGMVYWNQDEVPRRLEFEVIAPYKKGPLLREA